MKIVKHIIATAILVLAFSSTNAQTPPPPNGGGNPGSGNTPVGGGAPIAGGIGILLVLGAAYGGKKVYDYRKRKLAE
jgi:hypothetical protein